MIEEVPIKFEHEGRQYKGSFSEVSGGGAKTWHLMVDNYYNGRLRHTDTGWVFDPTPKTESMAELADYFIVRYSPKGAIF